MIAELIDRTIETRIKSTTVAKEIVNSALAATYYSGAGVAFQGARGLAYGSIAAYERYKNVTREIKDGKREEGLLKEYFVNGVWETYNNLKGGDAETKFGKARNIAGAVATISRTYAFAHLGIEYGPEFIDKALEVASLQAPQMPESMLEVPVAPVTAEVPEVPEPVAPSGSPITEGEAIVSPPAMEGRGEVIEPPASEVPVETVEPTSEAVPAGEVAPEVVEISKDLVQLGVVREGDGIVAIIAREMEANPKEFGFTGDVADKAAVASFAKEYAIAAARGSGVLEGNAELRLSKEAIDHLSVVVKPEGIAFIDVTSGEPVSPEQMETYTYTYLAPEHPTVPEAHAEAAKAPLERMATTEGGKVTFTYDGENVAGYDRGSFYESVSDADVEAARGMMSKIDVPRDEAEMIARTIAADVKVLKEMEASGLEDSAEYRYLVKDLTEGLRSVEGVRLMEIDENHPLIKPYFDRAIAYDVPAAETAGAIEISRDTLGLGAEWKMGDRTVEFTYDADGRVSGLAFGDMYDKITDKEWGAVLPTIESSKMMLTEEKSFATTTAQYIFTLGEMEKAGLTDRPEYAYLKEDFKNFIESSERAVKVDTDADIYKNYLEEHASRAPELPEREGRSRTVEDRPTRELRGMPQSVHETPVEVDAPITVERDPTRETTLLLQRPLIGSYGTVEFQYGPDGKVVGWDPELKYGIFARGKAVQLVEDTDRRLGTDDLGIHSGMRPTEGRMGMKPFVEYEPSGKFQAHGEIARQAYELVTTLNALRDAGYEMKSPERQFLRQQLLNLIKNTNETWRGELRMTAQNPDLRRALQ